jgi:hypothetical protein
VPDARPTHALDIERFVMSLNNKVAIVAGRQRRIAESGLVLEQAQANGTARKIRTLLELKTETEKS